MVVRWAEVSAGHWDSQKADHWVDKWADRKAVRLVVGWAAQLVAVKAA